MPSRHSWNVSPSLDIPELSTITSVRHRFFFFFLLVEDLNVLQDSSLVFITHTMRLLGSG